MSTSLQPFAAGGYRWLPGGFQYSAAVVAAPGHAIVRARLARPLPLAEGFERIASHLQAAGRPLQALCACELRSARPLVESDFVAFNRQYVEPLRAWGLLDGERNPVARCNLVPVTGAPEQAIFHAFSYTMRAAADEGRPDFITAGAAECPDRPGYRDHIVRLGETSPDALADKLDYALGDLEARLVAMQLPWAGDVAVRLYTAHDIQRRLAEALARRGAVEAGVHWHWVRPPVQDLEIELDARRISQELLLPA